MIRSIAVLAWIGFFAGCAGLKTGVQAKIPVWDEALARSFVKLSLECVDKEYPNMWERYDKQPKLQHPVFYGCYDWHSAVHGHWAMLRVLHAFPRIPEAAVITAKLDKHFQREQIQKELAYFQKVKHFELPYGYGWYFRLIQELMASPHPKAAAWRDSLRPLETIFIERLQSYLKRINRPARSGMHDNLAYALVHTFDYARASGNKSLLRLIQAKARELYGADKNCPLDYEPSSSDFISSCLIEADLMRRVLGAEEFSAWLAAFLPDLEGGSSVYTPVVPLDIKDPFLGHLLGLMFQKAASMQALAAYLPAQDSRRALLEASAKRHADQGIRLMFDSGYGGEHWLASFAIFHFSAANIF